MSIATSFKTIAFLKHPQAFGELSNATSGALIQFMG
jgi:hypothetical protein